MRRCLHRLAPSAALLCILIATIAPSQASAQDDPSQKVLSLDYQDAPVRDVLRAMFRSVSVSFTVAQEVQGPINVSLKNVTFEVALDNVLRQVNATYRVESGVYNILLRPLPEETDLSDDRSPIISSLIFEDSDVREAIRALFKQVSKHYVMAADVQGVVNANLARVPLPLALDVLLGQVDSTYRIQGGVYEIVRRQTVVGEAVPSTQATPAKPRPDPRLAKRLGDFKVTGKYPVEVFSQLFAKANVRYVIREDIPGKLTLDLRGLTIEKALAAVKSASRTSIETINGVYVVSRKKG